MLVRNVNSPQYNENPGDILKSWRMPAVFTQCALRAVGWRCCGGLPRRCPACFQHRAVRGWMWVPPTCLYFQIEDGGLGVPRRAAPLHRRREWWHSAALWTTAPAVRSEKHTRCCLHQSLQWWVDLFWSSNGLSQSPVLMLCRANACTANLSKCSISYREAKRAWKTTSPPCLSRGSP